MRVVVLGPYPPDWNGPMSGPMRVVGQLTRELAQLGIELRVIDISGRKRSGRRFVRLDGKVEVWSIAPYDMQSLLEGLETFRPDLVHIHGILPPFHAPLIFRNLTKAPYKTVYTIHGVVEREQIGFPSRLMMPAALQRSMLRHVSHAVAVSALTRNMVLNDHLLAPERLSVIGHGVDPAWLNHSDACTFNANKGDSSHQLLCVGGAQWIKGTDFLLEGLASFPLDNWSLTIAGKRTPYETRLRQNYGTLFRKGLIRCTGQVDQIRLAELYRRTSISLFLSRNETFGLAGLEAMAAGKPLIVSDRVGMSSLIDSGHNGIVVPFGDITKFQHELTKLLTNNKLRIEMGRQAQQTARQETWQQKAVEYCTLFRDLTSDSQYV